MKNYNFRDLFYTAKVCSTILQAGNIKPANHNIRIVGKTEEDKKLDLIFKIEVQQRMNAEFETLYVIRFNHDEEIIKVTEVDEDDDYMYDFSQYICQAKGLPKYVRTLLNSICGEYDPIELEQRRQASMTDLPSISRKSRKDTE